MSVAKPVFKKVMVEFKVAKSLAGTFASTPPPVRYLTFKVVWEGAIPYVLVNKKFSGE